MSRPWNPGQRSLKVIESGTIRWIIYIYIYIYIWGFKMVRGCGGVDAALVVTSWLVTTSGLYWLAMSVVSLVVPEPPSSVSAGISHFLWEFSFRSIFYFRFYTHTSASPRSWPGYHGGGRSCTWTGHGGYRSGFPRRRNRIRLAGQVCATYVTVWIWVHFYYWQSQT